VESFVIKFAFRPMGQAFEGVSLAYGHATGFPAVPGFGKPISEIDVRADSDDENALAFLRDTVLFSV
jgi:hypothetical protein